MNRPRACIVSPLFQPNLGGPGRQSFTLVKTLIQKGVEVIVITRKIDIEQERLNVPVYRIGTPRPDIHTLQSFSFVNFVISFTFSFGAVLRLIRLRRRYDVVHFFGAGLPLLFCLPVIKLLGKKVISKISGAKPGMEAGSLENAFFRLCFVPVYRLTDRFVAVSDELEKRLHAEGYAVRAVVRIPNGVDTAFFLPAAKPRRMEMRLELEVADRFVCVYTGRLTEGKGVEILLQAFKQLYDLCQDAVLFILGDGPLMPRFRDMTHSLGIGSGVRFQGNVENVNEYLAAADVFLFPSLREGMPNSLLEAMSCGLPVIASEIGGVVDVVENGISGILFRVSDTTALADAIMRLFRDAELREKMGKMARDRIAKHFSIDVVADQYIDLYMTASGARK